jgi:acetylornithine aminotransferase
VRELGGRLCDGLRELDGVAEVRGRGLMVGIGLPDGVEAAEIRDRALELGLVVNAPNASTIRLLPPLVIGEAEVDQALAILDRALG